MKIALLQTHLYWENPEKNRNTFEKKINAITDKVDLIILPEMFTSGFTMHPNDVAETMHGETLTWLKHLAKDKNSAITGSLVITENGNFYNR
jgi:omega-amidase